MNLGIFEDSGYRQLLPLTWTRACFELRCGCDRLIDKLQNHLGMSAARFWIRDPLRKVVSERHELVKPRPGDPWLLVNSRALLTGDIVIPPRTGVAWKSNGALIAATVPDEAVRKLAPEIFLDDDRLNGWLAGFELDQPPEMLQLVAYPWTLPLLNGPEIRRQCRLGGRCDGKVHPGAHVLNPDAIRIGEGALVKPGVVLDADDGPIFVDRGARIEANAVIMGPCYIGAQTIVRPGAVIRPDTSIGPVCKVGGEIEASIIHGYSNKQHDGFLGHSYLGQWVNLGADTVTSDLKNTYGTIRVSINGVGVETGQHFVGSIIGDHSKTGIGTILPTGCVVGTASNVFTRNVVPKFVPSFAWLTEAGITRYRVEKAVNIARTVMARRDVHLSDDEKVLLEHIAEAAMEVEASGWQ